MQLKQIIKRGIDNRTKIIVGVVVLIVLAALIFLGLPKNCKTNEECFNSKASKCSKVKVTLLKNDNYLNYYVLGESKDNCIVKVTMEKVSVKQSDELKASLQGKKMECSVPISILQERGLNQVENIYDYCTGPLKEAFLDITLQKMYDLVVKNLGTLTSGLQQVLNQSKVI